ncbi:MAG TPA: alpha/beta hydrolase [Candidatus Dormibacteraeota bacterium]|nr:alpha/beta hydrolase [Candidatus Dormibacteraeota bacterium]
MEWGPEQGAPVAPSILLLHGLGSNARYWDRVAAHLKSRRLVALDLTPASRENAGMEDLISGIASAIDDLHLDRPVVAGHSWGAGVALEFAVRKSEMLSGLVFVDGPIHGVARIFSWEEAEAIMQPDFPRYATLAEAIANTRKDLREAWGDDLEPFVEHGLRHDGNELVSILTVPVRHRLLRDLYDSDPEQLWPQVSVPNAALIARKSDARISRSTDAGMIRVAEIAPEVRIVRFPTPHDIPLFDPSGVAREIELVAVQAAAVKAQ